MPVREAKYLLRDSGVMASQDCSRPSITAIVGGLEISALMQEVHCEPKYLNSATEKRR